MHFHIVNLVFYAGFSLHAISAIAQEQSSTTCEDTIKWFASVLPDHHGNPVRFVRIDLHLNDGEKKVDVVGYEYGILLDSNDEFFSICNERLVFRQYKKSHSGSDLETISATAVNDNPSRIAADFPEHYAARRKQRVSLLNGPLRNDLLRYPTLPEKHLLLVHQLFRGLLDEDISQFIANLTADQVIAINSAYVYSLSDRINEMTPHELVMVTISDILCENAYLRVTDPAFDLTTCYLEAERLENKELSPEPSLFIKRLKDDLRRAIALNSASDDRFPSTGTLEELKRKIRNLTNTPFPHTDYNPDLDADSLLVFEGIKNELNGELTNELLKCNEPTRCVFIRDQWEYEPHVLTVAQILDPSIRFARSGPSDDR